MRDYPAPEDLNGLVDAYIAASNQVAEELLESATEEDNYSAASALRRTAALVGGDFSAAQLVAGLGADAGPFGGS
jgi:hypothetical protein